MAVATVVVVVSGMAVFIFAHYIVFGVPSTGGAKLLFSLLLALVSMKPIDRLTDWLVPREKRPIGEAAGKATSNAPPPSMIRYGVSLVRYSYRLEPPLTVLFVMLHVLAAVSTAIGLRFDGMTTVELKAAYHGLFVLYCSGNAAMLVVPLMMVYWHVLVRPKVYQAMRDDQQRDDDAEQHRRELLKHFR